MEITLAHAMPFIFDMGTISTGAGQNAWTQPGRAEQAPEVGQREREEKPVEIARLDHYLPSYDIDELAHVVVNASVERTYRALRELDFATIRSPLLRAGMAFGRMMLLRAKKKLGVQSPTLPSTMTFDNIEAFGRIKLEDIKNEEILIGAVGQLGKPETMLERLSAEEFMRFHRPGYFKAAASFSVRPYDGGRTLLSYEARMLAFDEKSQKGLMRFYAVMKPVMRAVMRRVLEHVKCEAERHTNKEAG